MGTSKRLLQTLGGKGMEILISCICSVIVSIVVGNIVGIYYLDKLNNDWKHVFDEVTRITIEEVSKLKK